METLKDIETYADSDLDRGNYNRLVGYPKIISALVGNKQYEKSVFYYRKMVEEIDPRNDQKGNARYYAELAQVYVELGKKDLAVEAMKKASGIDPNAYKEAGDQLIKALESR